MIKRLMGELISILGAMLTTTGSFGGTRRMPAARTARANPNKSGFDEVGNALAFMGVSPANRFGATGKTARQAETASGAM